MKRQKLPGRAVIVGAGIGGLCAAVALRRVGIEADVYERADTLGDVGAGLVLWANAVRVLRELGLADAVVAAGSPIRHGQVRTDKGRVLARSSPAELEAALGVPTVSIHRAALHKVLVQALPAANLHLGASCTGFEQDGDGVSARFDDGSRARADILIGADGLRSVVRQALFPQVALRYSGYTAWRGGLITAEDVNAGLTTESWGRGRRFGIVRLDRERVYWYATANTPPGRTWPADERKAHLLALFAGWHHPVVQLLEQTAAEAILHNDIYDIPPLPRWSTGRVTLLGDAAHATTPNLGQGACMAVESAFVLADCLAGTDGIASALAAYESRRRPRTAWITNQSRQVGRVAQWENPLACAVRNFVAGTFSERAMKAQLRRVVSGGPV